MQKLTSIFCQILYKLLYSILCYDVKVYTLAVFPTVPGLLIKVSLSVYFTESTFHYSQTTDEADLWSAKSFDEEGLIIGLVCTVKFSIILLLFIMSSACQFSIIMILVIIMSSTGYCSITTSVPVLLINVLIYLRKNIYWSTIQHRFQSRILDGIDRAVIQRCPQS